MVIIGYYKEKDKPFDVHNVFVVIGKTVEALEDHYDIFSPSYGHTKLLKSTILEYSERINKNQYITTTKGWYTPMHYTDSVTEIGLEGEKKHKDYEHFESWWGEGMLNIEDDDDIWSEWVTEVFEEDAMKEEKNELVQPIASDHYHTGNIDVIEFAYENCSKEEMKGFFKINVLKYVTRYDKKNGMEDLKKAQFYLEKLMELEDNE